MKVPKGRSVPVKFRSLWAIELDYRAKQAQSEPRDTCGCGFKIRGPNHESGIHHKKKHPKLRKGGK